MKFKMECVVESRTILESEIPILFNLRSYIFTPNQEGYLSKITIIADVEDPTKFYSIFTDNPAPGIKLKIDAKLDLELYDSVFKEFQELESILAFKYNLQGIDWKSPKYELIFDTEEERQKANLHSFQTTYKYKNAPVPASPQGLLEALQYKERMEPLVVPLAFYREGLNDHFSLKYINAFFNFYFIVEGLFGNNKTKNRDVENELKNSAMFKHIVDVVIEQAQRNEPKYCAFIETILKEKDKTLNGDSLIELIVSTRGELHHFQNNPKRRRGTPFRHKEYEVISHFAMALALHSILSKLVEINQASSKRDS